MIKILAIRKNISFTLLSSISTIGTYESTKPDIIGWIIDKLLVSFKVKKEL